MENLFERVIDHTTDQKKEAVNLDDITDPYERIEKEFPFYRVRINIFMETLKALGKEEMISV